VRNSKGPNSEGDEVYNVADTPMKDDNNFDSVDKRNDSNLSSSSDASSAMSQQQTLEAMLKRLNELIFTKKITPSEVEVTSRFHFSNLEHLDYIPVHLISTPRCPVNIDKSVHLTNKIPGKFYKGMNMKIYCEAMGLEY
jgi:hypothetical protein